MRILRRKAEERSLAYSGPVWPTNGWAAPQFPATPNDNLQIADVFACVRVLAGAAASLPLIPYRRTSTGRVRLESGRLAELLQRPSPATTQANLTSLTMTHLLLHGNAFLGKFKDQDGRLEQIGCLNPENVSVELVGGEPVYTVVDPETGRESHHGRADILHVRALSTDGLVGLSPLKACRLAVDYAKGMSESAAALTSNGFLPAGILKAPSMSRENLKELAEGLQAKHGGAANMHRVAVVTGDVQWTGLSIAADDLQFVQQRELSTREICRIFGVPPHLVGAASGDSMTYQNSETAAISFATYSLRPWLVLIEQAITQDTDLCFERQYVEFLMDGLLRADSKTRADVYALALDPNKGWMSREEVRRLENLDPETNPPAPVAPVVPQLNGGMVA